MDCNPTALLAAAKCYRCIPPPVMRATMISLLCQWANANPEPPGPCTHPVVDDWLARIAADASATTPSADQIEAVCQFCRSLDTYGLMDKMLVVNPVVNPPDDGIHSRLVTMLYPLIWQGPLNGVSPFENLGILTFNEFDLDDNGLIGFGFDSGNYLNSGFVPFTHWGLDTESGGLSIYESEPSPQLPDVLAAAESEAGVQGNGVPISGAEFTLSTWDPSHPIQGDSSSVCWNNLDEVRLASLVDDPGFYTSTRVNDTDFRLFKSTGLGGTVQLDINNGSQAGKPLPEFPVYFMAINSEGLTAANYSNKRVSFMAIHEGLTPQECADFFSCVQQLRIDLLGGYIV